HQAICPDRDLLCAAESRDELEVVLVILLTEERLLSVVSPLGDMVGHARSYHTCQSSHGGKPTRPQPCVKSSVWCPWNSWPIIGTENVKLFAQRSEGQRPVGMASGIPHVGSCARIGEIL